MTITDIFSALYTLLKAGTWTLHTVTPGIWEFDVRHFRANNQAGIMIKKNIGDSITLKSGKLLAELQKAEIVGWSKSTKSTRDKLFEDLVDILETDGGYVIKDQRRFDKVGEHNFRINIEKIEER